MFFGFGVIFALGLELILSNHVASQLFRSTLESCFVSLITSGSCLCGIAESYPISCYCTDIILPYFLILYRHVGMVQTELCPISCYCTGKSLPWQWDVIIFNKIRIRGETSNRLYRFVGIRVLQNFWREIFSKWKWRAKQKLQNHDLCVKRALCHHGEE